MATTQSKTNDQLAKSDDFHPSDAAGFGSGAVDASADMSIHAVGTTVVRGDVAAALGLAVAASAMLLAAPGASHAQTLVRDVDNPARQSFHALVEDQPIDTNRISRIALAKVPPGKLLVIEHVSFLAFGRCDPSAPSASSVFAHLEAPGRVDGTVGPQRHQLAVTKVVLSPSRCPSIGHSFVASQPIRAYIESGSPVSVAFTTFSDAQSMSVANVAVSGYLVDAQ